LTFLAQCGGGGRERERERGSREDYLNKQTLLVVIMFFHFFANIIIFQKLNERIKQEIFVANKELEICLPLFYYILDIMRST
jgi:hypothetical protein